MKKIENNSKELKSSLMNKALSYLSKFSTTESKLRSNLNSYCEKFFSEIKKELLQSEINYILNRCKELGYIDDETYAKNKIEKFINAGKSKKYIILKLQSYGISGKIIEKSLEKFFDKFSNNDFLAALNFARKKKIGPFYQKSFDEKSNLLNKWYGSFSRAGFNYDVSQKILNIETSFEAEKYLCNNDIKF
mgnify:FL=1